MTPTQLADDLEGLWHSGKQGDRLTLTKEQVLDIATVLRSTEGKCPKCNVYHDDLRPNGPLETCPASPHEADQPAARKDVVWIVNSLGELGVKVGDDFQFLYKGHSLRYEDPVNEEDGKPLMWRPVFKREFGECCHPVNYKDPTRWGEVSLGDSDEWLPLPSAPLESK